MKIQPITVLAGAALCLAACRLAAQDDFLERARDLNRRFVLVDTHVDIPLDYVAEGGADPTSVDDSLQVDLYKMAAGGVNCVFLVVYTPQGPRTEEDLRKARSGITDVRLEAIHRLCRLYPGKFELATSPEDVVRIAREGRKAVAIGMENGYPIGTDISLLRHYFQEGVRYITLSHNGHNDICDSANPPNRPTPGGKDLIGPEMRVMDELYEMEALKEPAPEPEHGGLSGFGREVVAEMNRLGMLIDLSHVAPATVSDVLASSRAPVIASHSSCRALCDNRRNLTDEQLRSIAAFGGVVQITAVSSFVSRQPERQAALEAALSESGAAEKGYDGMLALYESDRLAFETISARFNELAEEIDKKYPLPDVSAFCDHIDHAVQVMGIDHVGIGSDFGGGGGVKGFNNAAEAVNVTAELLRRGYLERDIEKIWGKNLLRLWKEVERVAERLGQ
ncbi:MAG: dipeptidase [Candidatus Glassbacteria bacterium]